jgi:hypothetical protein
LSALARCSQDRKSNRDDHYGRAESKLKDKIRGKKGVRLVVGAENLVDSLAEGLAEVAAGERNADLEQ